MGGHFTILDQCDLSSLRMELFVLLNIEERES